MLVVDHHKPVSLITGEHVPPQKNGKALGERVIG